MAETFWVQLYVGEETRGDAFELEPLPKNVGAIKKLVKDMWGEHLHCPAPELKVYAPSTPLPIGDGAVSLDPRDPVSAHCRDGETLIVKAEPLPQNDDGPLPEAIFNTFLQTIMANPEPKPTKLYRQATETNITFQQRVTAHFESQNSFSRTDMHDGGKHVLSVLYEPKGEDPWGMHTMAKQIGLKAPNLLFRRVGKFNMARKTRTLVSLSRKKMVLWLGAAGIGKSVALIDMLVTLVRALPAGGGGVVAFFRNSTLSRYSKNTDGSIAVLEKKEKLENVKSNSFPRIDVKHLCLLIDPPEDIVDFVPFCATLMSMSARIGNATLPSWFKSSGNQTVIVDPLDIQEVRAMVACVGAVDDKIEIGAVMNRYEQVGGLPRILFDEDMYDGRVADMDAVTCANLLEESVSGTLDPKNVPSHFKFFVAPCNPDNDSDTEEPDETVPDNDSDTEEPDETVPLGCESMAKIQEACFKSLSFVTATKLRALVEGDKDNKMMHRLKAMGIPYVVEENAIQDALLSRDTADWEWYENVASNRLVHEPAKSPPVLHVLMRERFQGRYYETALSTLKEGVLYISSGWQMVLGDMFVVHKKANGACMVYMIQGSSRDPCDHPFMVHQIEKWRTSLQMKDKDKLVVVYVTNKVHQKLHGLKFYDNDADGKECKTDCEAFVVRTKMTPGAPVNKLEKARRRNKSTKKITRQQARPTSKENRKRQKVAAAEKDTAAKNKPADETSTGNRKRQKVAAEKDTAAKSKQQADERQARLLERQKHARLLS